MEQPKDIFDRIMLWPVFRKLYPFYKNHKSILLYIFFGGLTTVVSVGSFILFDSGLGFHVLVSNLLSWIFAVSFAYVTNRVWVFESKAKGKAVFEEAASFVAGRLATLGIEELILLAFVTWLQWDSTWVKIGAQIVVLILNYVISKLLVFRKRVK